ncbi:MAG: hypothetical protein WA790_12335 [Sulfitobacter sp.]
MSDPVTNAEVEDVLSSIRRLVSEDKRPLQAQKPVPVNDRLVLTPALRVADPIEDQGKEVAGADQESVSGDEALFDDPAHDYEADPYNFDDDEDHDGEADAVLPEMYEAVTDQSEEDQIDLDADVDDDTGMVKTASLSAKIEALETAIGNISDTWEPDDTGGDDYSGTDAPAMAWEDDVMRDAMGTPLDDVADKQVEKNADEIFSASEPSAESTQAQDPVEDDSFAFASDDQLIDEEALRDLVSDIVRSELQGALGERITRNVRKLVRREIHRALTAQDLE